MARAGATASLVWDLGHALGKCKCSKVYPKSKSLAKEAPSKMASWRHSVPGLSGMLQAAAAPSSKQGSFTVTSSPIGQPEPSLPTWANRRAPNKKRFKTT